MFIYWKEWTNFLPFFIQKTEYERMQRNLLDAEWKYAPPCLGESIDVGRTSILFTLRETKNLIL